MLNSPNAKLRLLSKVGVMWPGRGRPIRGNLSSVRKIASPASPAANFGRPRRGPARPAASGTQDPPSGPEQRVMSAGAVCQSSIQKLAGAVCFPGRQRRIDGSVNERSQGRRRGFGRYRRDAPRRKARRGIWDILHVHRLGRTSNGMTGKRRMIPHFRSFPRCFQRPIASGSIGTEIVFPQCVMLTITHVLSHKLMLVYLKVYSELIVLPRREQQTQQIRVSDGLNKIVS